MIFIKTERVRNSFFNGLSNVLVSMSSTIMSFLVRTIFIKILGQEYLGLNGLFTNILSLLSLAELGFSTAISFSLYEPLAKKDIKKVNEIIIYLKKVYSKIAFLILFGGIIILPLLKYMVNGYDVNLEVYIIFLMYLLNTVTSYFFSYSCVLIEADQKNYKLFYIRWGFDLLTYVMQMVVLLLWENFILYLIVEFIIKYIQRFIMHNYIKKQYKDINFDANLKLDIDEKNKIKKNIKGIVFHRIGDYAVNGTDNILISAIVNISTTGVYSNYLSITSVFRSLISNVITATTSSFGNLNVTESCETKKNVFDILNFLTYFVSGIVIIGVYFCISNLIELWLGKEFLLGNICTIVICVNLYLRCILQSIDTIKNSAGLYYIDRYIPIIQAIINIIVSIVLGKKLGILGILLGTTISSICTVNITKPFIVYKYIFESSSFEYFLKTIKNIILIIITFFLGGIILKKIAINNLFLLLILKGLISVIIYSLIYLCFNFRSKEFKYCINALKNIKIKKA